MQDRDRKLDAGRADNRGSVRSAGAIARSQVGLSARLTPARGSTRIAQCSRGRSIRIPAPVFAQIEARFPEQGGVFGCKIEGRTFVVGARRIDGYLASDDPAHEVMIADDGRIIPPDSLVLRLARGSTIAARHPGREAEAELVALNSWWLTHRPDPLRDFQRFERMISAYDALLPRYADVTSSRASYNGKGWRTAACRHLLEGMKRKGIVPFKGRFEPDLEALPVLRPDPRAPIQPAHVIGSLENACGPSASLMALLSLGLTRLPGDPQGDLRALVEMIDRGRGKRTGGLIGNTPPHMLIGGLEASGAIARSSARNLANIDHALEKGGVALVAGGDPALLLGHETSRRIGHWIAILGRNGNGEFVVGDPRQASLIPVTEKNLKRFIDALDLAIVVPGTAHESRLIAVFRA
jgi:hypothetical protein